MHFNWVSYTIVKKFSRCLKRIFIQLKQLEVDFKDLGCKNKSKLKLIKQQISFIYFLAMQNETNRSILDQWFNKTPKRPTLNWYNLCIDLRIYDVTYHSKSGKLRYCNSWLSKGPSTQAIFAAILVAIFSFWRMWRSIVLLNDVDMRFDNLDKGISGTFITHPLLHILQKKKIATKIACVNGP